MTPILSLSRRVGLAFAIVMVIAIITWLDRDGYSDAAGGGLTFLDAVYYSTVTVSPPPAASL